MIVINQFATPILILVYILITFGYSVGEKLFGWKESVSFYRNHFDKTSLKNGIPFLLKVVIILEIITVILCLIGLYNLLILQQKDFSFYGLIVAAITLIGLMIGQRIAKDYAGAMNITVYFILTVFGVFLLQ